MDRTIEIIASLLIMVTWLAGIVIAKGFWSSIFAILIPPYAWYLVIEKLMLMNGWF